MVDIGDMHAHLKPPPPVGSARNLDRVEGIINVHAIRRVDRANRLADGPFAERSPPSSPRARAHLAAAKANVVGPDAPVRAVLVEDLARGLSALARELGLPLDASAAAVVENAAQAPAAALGAADRARVEATLALDVALYDAVAASRGAPPRARRR